MEDVLDLYAEAPDASRPLVCFDEKPYQLLSHKRPALPLSPGQAERIDYEYKREGTRNLFLFFDPHRGWRRLEVTAQRTAADFAHQMKWLVDHGYPQAELIRVVLDNLNTHTPASLYQTFAPEEARRITQKLEFRYTPKHASWLNMAEIEFSVLERSASTGGSPVVKLSLARSPPGRPTATRRAPPSTGASPPRMPEPSCTTHTPQKPCD